MIHWSDPRVRRDMTTDVHCSADKSRPKMMPSLSPRRAGLTMKPSLILLDCALWRTNSSSSDDPEIIVGAIPSWRICDCFVVRTPCLFTRSLSSWRMIPRSLLSWTRKILLISFTLFKARWRRISWGSSRSFRSACTEVLFDVFSQETLLEGFLTFHWICLNDCANSTDHNL